MVIKVNKVSFSKDFTPNNLASVLIYVMMPYTYTVELIIHKQILERFVIAIKYFILFQMFLWQ